MNKGGPRTSYSSLEIISKKCNRVFSPVDDAGFDGLELHLVNKVFSIDRGRIEVWVDNDVDVVNIRDHSPLGFRVLSLLKHFNLGCLGCLNDQKHEAKKKTCLKICIMNY